MQTFWLNYDTRVHCKLRSCEGKAGEGREFFNFHHPDDLEHLQHLENQAACGSQFLGNFLEIEYNQNFPTTYPQRLNSPLTPFFPPNRHLAIVRRGEILRDDAKHHHFGELFCEQQNCVRQDRGALRRKNTALCVHRNVSSFQTISIQTTAKLHS